MFDAYSFNSSNWDFEHAHSIRLTGLGYEPLSSGDTDVESLRIRVQQLRFSSFDTPMDFAGAPTPYDQHRLDTLQDLHDSALEHYQQCMDDGMYISATMWQQQANDIQNDINDMTYGG